MSSSAAPTVVTFGEIMGRLTPVGLRRLKQAMPGELEMTFAGAEANVAVSLAQLGRAARFVTAVPANPLGDACRDVLRGLGVDTQFVLQNERGRMGLYFVEAGANQRPSRVVYDRAGSAISQTPAEDFRWDEIFAGAQWFHVTGITPALSAIAAQATLTAVQAARSAGLTVSCDLNFRKKLWNWDPQRTASALAEHTMRQLLPWIDVVIANEEDAADVLGIHAAETDVQAGRLQVDRYPDVARQIVQQFENVQFVAITLRESVSASHNRWGAMLYDAAQQQAHFAPGEENYQPYEITHIVDRVGAGDAFAAGLIYALTSDACRPPARAVRFATAASCLAHSILGDFNLTSRQEVEALMGGGGSGRVER